MAATALPDWLQVGAIIENGGVRYSVTQVLEPTGIIVLRDHKDNFEARYPVSLILRNYRPCVGLQPWMRVGVRLRGPGPSEDEAVIVAVRGTEIQIREIDSVLGENVLQPTIRTFEAKELGDLYVAIEQEVPRWFAPGSRIVLRSSNQVYEIRTLDALAGAFTASTPEDPVRVQRFNLRGYETTWMPFSSLPPDEEGRPRRALAPAVIPVSTIPTAPDWLQPGSLIRPTNRNWRRSFWVTSVHPDRGMCRIQRVVTFDPLQMEPGWEELAYEVAERDWEPLNADGSPLAEKKCPHCGAWGGRFQEAEAGNPYSIRVYHCSNAHRWSFIDGGTDDGKPAPPTRFEREIDL